MLKASVTLRFLLPRHLLPPLTLPAVPPPQPISMPGFPTGAPIPNFLHPFHTIFHHWESILPHHGLLRLHKGSLLLAE